MVAAASMDKAQLHFNTLDGGDANFTKTGKNRFCTNSRTRQT
jgi:hypothetical protein